MLGELECAWTGALDILDIKHFVVKDGAANVVSAYKVKVRAGGNDLLFGINLVMVFLVC